METLLIFAIVILSIAICIVAGFWYYRDRQARNRGAPAPRTVRRQAGNERWDAAVRASRNHY